jgi:SAM-dependent methyltransferase
MLAAARDRLIHADGDGLNGVAGDHLNGVGPAGGEVMDSPGVPGERPVATRPGAVAVALAGADATALPLRDGVADLALAPHMLYHVPEPADALRELRRVTRPGGRVIIVLNGAGHLRELRAAVAAASGGGRAAVGERIRLDDGESLARSLFSQVIRHDFVARLRVPNVDPIVDYVRSTSRKSMDADLDPERVARAAAAALPRDPEGHYAITSHSGCLICTVG